MVSKIVRTTFSNGMINIKSLNPNKIKTDEKSNKTIFTYHISTVTLNSVKPLYLSTNKVNGCD